MRSLRLDPPIWVDYRVGYVAEWVAVYLLQALKSCRINKSWIILIAFACPSAQP